MKIANYWRWLIVFSTLGLTACATQERFTWGTYDASLYAYSKHPDQLPQYEKSLGEAIAAGRASGHLAPGLQAELGYCYLGEGKRAEALEQFKAEMASFPEATPFMTRIIAQVQGS
jgi:hypothetical protein